MNASTAELDLTLKAEEILADELAGYAGCWVAVRDHRVVASADSLGELLSRVNPEGLDRILEVSRDPKAGCFF
ncbi:MAG TPA: DUF5678 domain-containing protein [Solirubrobacterales bacterium]|nr:DUF5678 domain-containing protein [Solirubrobacterales bacterium]